MKKQDRQRITNITRLDEDHYHRINRYESNSGLLGTLFVTGSIFCLLDGCRSLLKDPTSPRTWMMFFLGFLIVPLLTYVLPYMIRKSRYANKKLSDICAISFEKDQIEIRNGQSDTLRKISYEEIVALKESNDLLILNCGGKGNLYMDRYGFVSDNPERAKLFLERKTGKRFPKVKEKKKSN